MTPTYPYPGKRPVIASTFYPALKEDNVELVPTAVVEVTPSGIVDGDGVERAVDVIVMATGFQAANYLACLRVTGRSGETLDEHWAGEPRAYLGITVPGFPNFFMLYGPGKPAFEALWFVWLQSKMQGTSWTMSNSYFRSSTGKIVTQWPSGNLVYRALTKILGSMSEVIRCRERGP